MFIRFGEEQDTDYAHIGNRVKYLPQNLFMPANMSLDEAFKLYRVDYDGLVSFAPKFHPFQHKRFKELSGGEARVVDIIVSDHLYEAIMQVADDLFLLRDGYTFPIKSREDLIHHGYILR